MKRAREGSIPLPSVLETAAPPWLEPEWWEHAQDGVRVKRRCALVGSGVKPGPYQRTRFTGDGDPLSPRLVLVLEPQGGLAREPRRGSTGGSPGASVRRCGGVP